MEADQPCPGDAEKVRVAEPVKALRVAGMGQQLPAASWTKLQETAKTLGADWFSYIKVSAAEPQSPLVKPLGAPAVAALATSVGARPATWSVLGLKVRLQPRRVSHA